MLQLVQLKTVHLEPVPVFMNLVILRTLGNQKMTYNLIQMEICILNTQLKTQLLCVMIEHPKQP